MSFTSFLSKMVKILLINDSSSNPNWGDRAAAISLKTIITKHGGSIEATISEEELSRSNFDNLVDRLPQGRKKEKMKRIVNAFTPPILFHILDKSEQLLQSLRAYDTSDMIPKRLQDFDLYYKRLMRNRGHYSALFDKMQQTDLTIIHGNGCMMGNNRVARAELFLTYVIKRHFNKPVIIVNHTADFEHSSLLEIAYEIYPLFDDVVFRDTISVERCRSLCEGRFAPDTAFLFSPVKLEQWLPVAQRPTYFDVWPDSAAFNPAEPYICIGGSSLFYYVKDAIDPAIGFSGLINHIRSIYPGQILLTVSDLQDEAMFRQLANRFGLPLMALRTPVQQAVDVLGNAQAYIGGRWHPSIFALRGGTPVIPIASITFKMQALMEMAGLRSNVFDGCKLEEETGSVGDLLMEYWGEGEKLRKKLRDWAAEQSLKSLGNINFLKRILA